ncbi:MAG: hormogonium polysaccharide biosynthesis protein HpsA [Cyanobacteria bacterium P01_F01_bin.150]
MQLHNIFQGFWTLIKWINHRIHMFMKALMVSLLRCLFLFSQPSRIERGFILPTTVLLILVVTLAVGSMTLRTLNRTSQVAGDRQQRIIYNAATPTMDRAKAKLEFLFDTQRNPLYPNGIPDQAVLNDMMLNDSLADNNYIISFEGCDGNQKDPFTFPADECDYTSAEAETRIDIDGDGNNDNAWSYRIDMNEDGTLDASVAYSIIFNKPSNSDANNKLENASDIAISNRAQALQVRHGPLSIPIQDNGCGSVGGDTAESDDGWSKPVQGGATLYKNFQINVFVKPDDPATTVSTLEFHQDRKIDEGNKWGAWFRNDLEIYPGAEFNWNGAMHTEGNLFMGNTNFEGYLISSPASCYYSQADSEVTVADRSAPVQANNFEGQIISAQLKDNDWDQNDNSSKFHLFRADGNITNADIKALNITNDSVDEDGSSSAPADYLLDPVVLATQDISKARNFPSDTATEDGNPAPSRAEEWPKDTNDFFDRKRLYNQTEDTPSVDDSFRADNRYGPKARIDGQDIPGKIGEKIDSSKTKLINLGDDFVDDFTNVGLDGYWERRARAEGSRFIVGQRLELGNTFSWGGLDKDGDYLDLDIDDLTAREPLMPWDGCDEYQDSTRCEEGRQRRSLRDNLAAVQATAVYHANAANGDKDFPIACLASTVHPGTPYTLQNSSTFLDWTKGLEGYWDSADFGGTSPQLISDFFRGEGTNGWEYAPPSSGNASTFGTDLAETQPLGKALRNWAYFAGDPEAGAPSFTPTQEAGKVHPYPLMSMWGDASVLRRIFAELDNTSYANLSPADKTTLQTAACSLGMLANELYILEKFQYANDIEAPPGKYGAGTPKLLDVLNARLIALSLNKANASKVDDTYNQDALDALGITTDQNGDTVLDGDDLPDYWAEPPLDQSTNKPYGYYNKTTTLSSRFDNLNNEGDDPERYIARLQQWHDADLLAFDNDRITDATLRLQKFNVDDDLINLAKIIMLREQTIRDRSWGFMINGNFGKSQNCLAFTSVSSYFSDAYGVYKDLNSEQGLKKLCSDRPKFGALYSIFPGEQFPSSEANKGIGTDDNHGEDHPFSRGLDNTDDIQIITSVNSGNDLYKAMTDDDLAAISLQPLAPTSWNLPHGTPSTANDDKLNPNDSGSLMVTCNVEVCSSGTSASNHTRDGLYQTQTMAVALKDASIYNGREYMSVRLMDLDLDMLRENNGGLSSTDRWLPNSGIVYAFREDAVREDAITRPSRLAWASCDNDAAFATGSTACHMDKLDEVAENATDPPLNDTNAISPKPVDYAPDPDRRPNGFRLTNGERLKRPNDQGKGLSFVTDNALYVKGHFNLHQDSQDNPLEEFSDYLLYSETDSSFDKFYDRKIRDNNFATTDGDEWRPSELLADAITIVSNNFCDGSMFDSLHSANTDFGNVQVNEEENDSNRKIKGYSGSKLGAINRPWRSLYGCVVTNANRQQTSYANGVFQDVNVRGNTHQLPQDQSRSGFEEYWQHVNPFDTRSPYTLTRQGNPRIPLNGGGYNGDYFLIGETDAFTRPSLASYTNVNAIIISGAVPSRPGQSYGGLHNFPRMLENWGGTNRNGTGDNVGLRISGSLMQLNFSHTSVAPYDHDAWNPGQESDSNSEPIPYYWPPTRLWGYDVGLQKGVAGPMAKRFVSGAEPTRSEFYSEPPADDPYVYNLCQAISTDCYRDPPLD